MSGTQKRKLPLFYVIYFAALAVGVAVLVIFLLNVNSSLAEFEKKQPENIADKVFSENFAAGDVDKLVSLADVDISPFESKEQLKAYFSEKLSGAAVEYVRMSSDSTQSADILKYAVKAGDTRIASFSLRRTNTKKVLIMFQSSDYELAGFELFYPKKESVSVKIPSDFTLQINKNSVGDEFVKKSDIPHYEQMVMPEGLNAITYKLYTVSGLIAKPEITVLNKNGETADVGYDENEKIYYADVQYDASLESQYGEYVLEAAEKYASYMEGDLYLGSINKYFDHDSELYKGLKQNLNFVWDHDSYSFENTKVSEFYRYNETTFSCRVSFKHVLTRGREVFNDYFDTTYFFHEINGTYLIFYSFTHN